MTQAEAQIVRNALDAYPAYHKLAQEADALATLKQQIILDMADIKSPGWNDSHSQNPTPQDSILIAAITDRDSAILKRKAYAMFMAEAQKFIHLNFRGEVHDIMMDHFVYGKSYGAMEDKYDRSSTGIRSIVDRALLATDFDAAQDILWDCGMQFAP